MSTTYYRKIGPQRGRNHKEAMRVITNGQVPNGATVSKIDRDPLNTDDHNLHLFHNIEDFNRANQDLNKILSELIKKGFINFSKKTGLYDFAKQFKEFIQGKEIIEVIYSGRNIDLNNNKELEELKKQITTATNKIRGVFKRKRTGSTDTHDPQQLSFTPKRGYRGIMERIIQRQLQPGEEVHHIDHDHSNNKDENLFLCTSQQHHTYIHKLLNRLTTVLIRKGLISFKRRKNTYEPSKELSEIMMQRQILETHKSKRLERETRGKLENPTITVPERQQVPISSLVKE